MRRPHRSIETFDISLMAVVTKAMGAFLVLMLLLLPYYTPNARTQEVTEELLLQLKVISSKIHEASRQLGPPGNASQGPHGPLQAAPRRLS
jgi:type II secretory pathway pseudopilin PulG